MASVRAAIALFVLLRLLSAQRVGVPTEDLSKVGIDELFSVEVTSVDKKAQQLSKAPAAIFVLTADDIRRTGATCIPEALQWVPGLTVLQINGRDWVVSARGSARQYANKMLVMVDGRSLYTPLFAGVIWDAIDVPMQDIEQIEVIRGPGAVMWGPNAVNGVINIITKKARRTEGGSVSVSAGNDVRASLQASDNASLSEGTAVRFWGGIGERTPGFGVPATFLLDSLVPYQTAHAADLDDYGASAGIRLDSRLGERDDLLIQANGLRSGRQDPLAYVVVLPTAVAASQGHSDYETGSLQALWTHTGSADTDSSLQFTFDQGNYHYPFLGAASRKLSLDYQRRSRISARHELYFGAGFQQYSDSTTAGARIALQPEAGPFRDGSLTVRDEFQASSHWMLSAGVRADYNSYTHFEWQPSFRILYTPGPRQSFWAGWSRAVRLPSRWDRDIDIDLGAEMLGGLPIESVLSGSHAMRSEVERSWEAGYRYQQAQRWSADVSVYWSNYDHLRASQIAQPTVVINGSALKFVSHTIEDNAGTGRTYGAEIWGRWQATDRWRIVPSYSYANETLSLPPGGYVSGIVLPGQYIWDNSLARMRHQVSLRSQHDLFRHLQLDLMARAHSHIAGYNLPGTLLEDVRLGWRPTRRGELSVLVQDITGRRVLEAYAEGPLAAIPLRRTATVQWKQRF